MDLGLLKLDQHVDFNSKRMPVCLDGSVANEVQRVESHVIIIQDELTPKFGDGDSCITDEKLPKVNRPR